MPGNYGNMNIVFSTPTTYITFAGTSEAVTLPVGTQAVSLNPTEDCWIYVGDPGETAVAAAPSGEKVWSTKTKFLAAGQVWDIGIPPSSDASLVQIAVIQATVGGNLHIDVRNER
jgi:hypothetical protein